MTNLSFSSSMAKPGENDHHVEVTGISHDFTEQTLIKLLRSEGRMGTGFTAKKVTFNRERRAALVYLENNQGKLIDIFR